MDRHTTSPFALQLFYRTGAFHRPDEFTTDPLPPCLTLHTWPDCTLDELAQHISIADEKLLPNPAIGTRLAFRLLYHDTRGLSGGRGGGLPGSSSSVVSGNVKFTVRELGSVVIGDGGPGLDPNDDGDQEGEGKWKKLEDTDPDKTLQEARFVVGDYISCAILPPLPDGSVAPASSARMGRGTGAGEARVAVGRAPYEPPMMRDRNGSGSFARHGRGPGGGGGGGRAGVGFGSGRNGFDGGGFPINSHRGSRIGASRGVPMGEWRRGEQLPEAPPGRNRGNRF
ncbi:hypothetical protein F5Y17DRAFT_302274 [Xylariaceae sp. FL0594]|nr:hypothetical protein F5Y17DRAFT_302274 [Xylariaceae sp. FL0594]